MATTDFIASGLYTPSAGVTKVLVQTWGGGGGGGAGGSIGAGGGGGGGAFAQTNLVTVAVGAGGGTGGAYVVTVGSASASGIAGRDSWFSTTAVAPTSTTEGALAKGGGLGGAGSTSAGSQGAGGTAAASIGDTKFSGGTSTGGNGGGGAGTTGAASGQSGHAVGGGNGGNVGGAAANGSPGSTNGGAGGGAGALGTSGGTGARGEVYVTEVLEINVSESITITESKQFMVEFFVNKSDSVTVSEAIQLLSVGFVNANETVGIFENTNNNLLSADDNSFEGGVGTWTSSAAFALTAPTDQAKIGTHSLKLVRNAPGGAGSAFTGLYDVTAGLPYFAAIYSKTALTARAFFISIYWYQSDGTTFISNIDGALSADVTTSWSRATVGGLAPALAAKARVLITYNNSVTGEVHYMDDTYFGLVYPFATLVYNVNGVSDSITVSEASAFTLVLNAAANDSITVSEALSVFKILFILQSQNVTITESIAFTLVSNVNVSENLNSSTPTPTPSPYILLDNGVLAKLVADISPYPLYQRL